MVDLLEKFGNEAAELGHKGLTRLAHAYELGRQGCGSSALRRSPLTGDGRDVPPVKSRDLVTQEDGELLEADVGGLVLEQGHAAFDAALGAGELAPGVLVAGCGLSYGGSRFLGDVHPSDRSEPVTLVGAMSLEGRACLFPRPTG